jgi:tetratricopeptide (TPR) repeat protein
MLATLISIGTMSVASADQRDPNLPTLFKFLKSAQHSEQAGPVEDKIWEIWSMTGDHKLDQLMVTSSEAMQRGDYKGALLDIDQILHAKPDFAEGWNKRATVYYLMGDFAHSLEDIDRTLELEPRHIGALSGLGLVNIRMEREEAAADAFERVLNIDPQSVSAKNNLAIVKDILKRKSI